MKLTCIIQSLLTGVFVTLTSCVGHYKPPMVRTTTYHPGMFGAPATSSVTETPYESPAYTAAGKSMFARP